jgi:hypothetical protein
LIAGEFSESNGPDDRDGEFLGRDDFDEAGFAADDLETAGFAGGSGSGTRNSAPQSLQRAFLPASDSATW